MAVEIFIEPELEELSLEERSEEWHNLCKDLSMEGQLSLCNSQEGNINPPPYTYMDPKTQRIVSVLCPRKVLAKDYKASTIPLDVLKEISKASAGGWYSKIWICYDDVSDDPFVIGLLNNSVSFNGNLHMIARWGNEILPFEILEKKAIERMKKAVKSSYRNLKKEIDFVFEDIDSYCEGLLTGNSVVPSSDFSAPNFSTW